MQIDREIERETHSIIGSNGQNWAGLKLGTKSFLWASHVDAGA